MGSFECDVVVIGAGLSGLSSAFFLAKKDRSLTVVVLEAKDRIGGRTLTRQLTSADGTKDFWDLGGEWVGRPQPHLQYLIHKFNINTFNPVTPPDGKDVVSNPTLSWQTRLDLSQFIWKVKRLRKKLLTVDLSRSVNALKWDSVTFESYREENLWSQDAKNIVDAACRCMFGLAPSEMTLLYFLMYIKSAGGLKIFTHPKEYDGGECRIKGGVQQLSTHLANMIGRRLVYLNQPVIRIKQSIEGARITTENQMEILCQHVILAVPPHHAADIEFQPPLPAVKLGLLKSVPLAFLVKFAITYEEAFWKENNENCQYGFQALLEDTEIGPVGLVYDASSGRGNPALSGFVSQTLNSDPNSRRDIILRLIENILDSRCRNFLEFSQKDWGLEPYNGGCFLKSIMPGTTKYFNKELREPFDRVHFAGTETATVWCGFMNGAVQSGFRAATEVLYHLRPLIVSSPDPDAYCLVDKEPGKVDKPHSWLTWAVLGMGFASAVYLLSRTDKLSTGSTFVKNIRLVFES